MKQEQQLLYKVMQNFEGMQKIEVFDVLHKIEILLFQTKSPITREGIARIINSEIDRNKDVDPLQFTILPNGNFCEFVGSNTWIHIYKEQKRGLLNYGLLETYYFKTKYAPLELSKLTKRNLLEYIQDTPEEHKVKQFLQSHRISKKDMMTNKLLLLSL
ncbi:hypothetical protein [Aquimarina sp. SS2-1]|uniref:hypothetical protein n=1 Tax=Aquimarina besae TaxID=3342247 RepID=UPI0036711E0D